MKFPSQYLGESYAPLF